MMSILQDGIDWVWRDYFWQTFNIMCALFFATALIASKFNHQHYEQKWRNTWRIATTMLATMAFAICLDIEHGIYARLGIKVVLFATATLTIVAADWFSFWIWCMANFHEVETGHTGAPGWMFRAPRRAWAWIKAQWAKIPLIRKRLLAVVTLFLVLAACLTVTTTTATPSAEVGGNAPAIVHTLNAQYQTEAAFTPTATAAPINRPTGTPTPTSSIRELPQPETGTYIYEIPPEDVDILARLCVVEVRGFGSQRASACASVVSTVLERMRRHYLSDGTVAGTIAWGCLPGVIDCQFPAYVVNGCDGILPASCPHNYPGDIAYFRGVVRDFQHGQVRGQLCLAYLYYGSRNLDMSDCVVEGNGQREGFHNS